MIWVECVQKCLTQFLVPLYKEDKLNCTEIKDKGFASQPDCYSKCGFCKIWEANMKPLWSTLSICDVANKDSIKQILLTVGKCMLSSLFPDVVGKLLGEGSSLPKLPSLGELPSIPKLPFLDETLSDRENAYEPLP
jgi:hypothetical protein